MPRSRRGLKGFFREVGREMKKVTWPSKRETNRMTGVVLIVCMMISAAMIGMSYAFGVVVNIITRGYA